jgi:type IV pilus assembly protein PilW
MRYSTHQEYFKRRQLGMTLVELLVAMTISLGMVAALVTLLVNNSRSTAELNRTSRQTENGRYAMELLSHDLKLAGYYGELATADVTFTTVDPCAATIAGLGFAPAAVPATAPVAIQGFAGSVADPAPGCALNHRPGTAAIVVRHLSTEFAAAVTAGNGYLQTSRCATDPVVVPFVFSDVAANFTLRDRACAGAMQVRRYITRVYYVADCDLCGKDTIPTLKRAEFVDGAIVITALAEGVEELQFEYGFDVDGDGGPDQFRTNLDGVVASALNDWSNVMAVRITLLSRTTEESAGYLDAKTYGLGLAGNRGPFNDRYKRRALSQLVRLNNPAGWRE